MQSFHNLNEWLAWLETLHPKEIDLGLVRIRQVAQQLGLSQFLSARENLGEARRPILVTVAGTNGKGSFVTSCEHLLAHAGKSTGAYTSPHILAYNERIRINGEPVSDAAIVAAFVEIDAARGDITLTYFEFSTLAAILIFRQHNVDYWLLEVGLGGRLDAVNCFHTDLAVITSIDLDHQNWLGDSREQIAVEKAGIVRDGSAVICAELNPPASLLEILPADTFYINDAFSWALQESGVVFSWLSSDNCRLSLFAGCCQLPLPSVAAAIQAMALLGVLNTQSRPESVIESLSLAGRLQTVTLPGDGAILLDVAHNPAATALLANNLAARFANQTFIAVVSMMADKDLFNALAPMVPKVKHWLLLPLPEVPRAAHPERLKSVLMTLGVSEACIAILQRAGDLYTPDKQALRREYRSSLPLLVFGSFYAVADVLQEIN